MADDAYWTGSCIYTDDSQRQNEEALAALREKLVDKYVQDDGTLRTFPGGATRDTADGKPVPWRYGSALADKRYGEYMLGKQVQTDGKTRAGDNWKNGFGLEVLADSLSRHVTDLRLHLEGFADEATEQDIETVLCAIRFNTDGYLHELLVQKRAQHERHDQLGLW
jgi:hypothetical protein